MKTITIEMPETVVPGFAATPEEFSRELRLAAAIEWYREGRISQGKAAEVAGLNRWELIEALGRARVDVIAEEVVLEDLERAVREHQKRRTRSAAESEAPVPFAADAAEIHYRALGRWKCQLAASDVQAAAREFWRSAGAVGAIWLAERLRWERQVEALHAVAAVLADVGPVALGPIAAELDDHPAPDQTLALLQALGWIGESPGAATVEEASFELMLARFLQHRDPDTREAAARAMRLLPPERAAHWLDLRRRDEPDADVRETIDEERSRRRPAGD